MKPSLFETRYILFKEFILVLLSLDITTGITDRRRVFEVKVVRTHIHTKLLHTFLIIKNYFLCCCDLAVYNQYDQWLVQEHGHASGAQAVTRSVISLSQSTNPTHYTILQLYFMVVRFYTGPQSSCHMKFWFWNSCTNVHPYTFQDDKLRFSYSLRELFRHA